MTKKLKNYYNKKEKEREEEGMFSNFIFKLKEIFLCRSSFSNSNSNNNTNSNSNSNNDSNNNSNSNEIVNNTNNPINSVKWNVLCHNSLFSVSYPLFHVCSRQLLTCIKKKMNYISFCINTFLSNLLISICI